MVALQIDNFLTAVDGVCASAKSSTLGHSGLLVRGSRGQQPRFLPRYKPTARRRAFHLLDTFNHRGTLQLAFLRERRRITIRSSLPVLKVSTSMTCS
ncbi:hypothetical protein V5799_024377 [Amblyomma americanum]|uniref:Uncharacterized protein n=1 Tax=Amblyomma americanum TaxID=6943 RepID=A0AAQ4ECQ8_AMBAM